MARSSLADWRAYWSLGKTDSLEGGPRFQTADLVDRLEQDPFLVLPAYFRLARLSPGKGAGPGGKDLGADVDLVGPGAAYERWRTMKEYRSGGRGRLG